MPHERETASVEERELSTVAEGEWTFEAMTSDQRARLPELAAALALLQETWEGLTRTLTINEIDDFSQQVSRLAEEYGHEGIVKWGKRLSTQAVSFDLDGMTSTLNEFPALLRELEAIG